MKVTVIFGETKVVVPCGDGNISIKELSKQAILRFQKSHRQKLKINSNDKTYALKESFRDISFSDITIDSLAVARDGGILDWDDFVIDVLDDKELLIAEFNNDNDEIAYDKPEKVDDIPVTPKKKAPAPMPQQNLENVPSPNAIKPYSLPPMPIEVKQGPLRRPNKTPAPPLPPDPPLLPSNTSPSPKLDIKSENSAESRLNGAQPLNYSPITNREEQPVVKEIEKTSTLNKQTSVLSQQNSKSSDDEEYPNRDRNFDSSQTQKSRTLPHKKKSFKENIERPFSLFSKAKKKRKHRLQSESFKNISNQREDLDPESDMKLNQNSGYGEQSVDAHNEFNDENQWRNRLENIPGYSMAEMVEAERSMFGQKGLESELHYGKEKSEGFHRDSMPKKKSNLDKLFMHKQSKIFSSNRQSGKKVFSQKLCPTTMMMMPSNNIENHIDTHNGYDEGNGEDRCDGNRGGGDSNDENKDDNQDRHSYDDDNRNENDDHSTDADQNPMNVSCMKEDEMRAEVEILQLHLMNNRHQSDIKRAMALVDSTHVYGDDRSKEFENSAMNVVNFYKNNGKMRRHQMQNEQLLNILDQFDVIDKGHRIAITLSKDDCGLGFSLTTREKLLTFYINIIASLISQTLSNRSKILSPIDLNQFRDIDEVDKNLFTSNFYEALYPVCNKFQSIPGVCVKSIIPEGAAVKDGRLQIGDRLLKIDGQNVTNLPQASIVSLLRVKPSGQTINLVLWRYDNKPAGLIFPTNLRKDFSFNQNPVSRQTFDNTSLLDSLCPLGSFDDSNLNLRNINKNRRVFCFKIPLNQKLKEVNQDYESRPSYRTMRLGVSVKEVDSLNADPMINFEPNYFGGVIIKSIIDGGSAQADGRLRAGDEIISVDDVSLIQADPSPLAMLRTLLKNAMSRAESCDQEGIPASVLIQVVRHNILKRSVSGHTIASTSEFNQPPSSLSGQEFPNKDFDEQDLTNYSDIERRKIIADVHLSEYPDKNLPTAGDKQSAKTENGSNFDGDDWSTKSGTIIRTRQNTEDPKLNYKNLLVNRGIALYDMNLTKSDNVLIKNSFATNEKRSSMNTLKYYQKDSYSANYQDSPNSLSSNQQRNPYQTRHPPPPLVPKNMSGPESITRII